jgi:hypothetical protein
MNTAIPNLAAKGYRNVGPTMPEGVPSIGTPEGYMARSPGGAQKRDVNELRMLAGQNADADIAGTAAPNVLNPQEQAMIDALERDRNNRDATMAERQKLVTQNAQKREATRDFQQDPQAAIFAQLTQAVQGGGQGGALGPPDPKLAMLAPKVYAAQLEAWEASQNQQRLDQRDDQLDLDRDEGRRRFDVSTGLQREGMNRADRRHDEEMAAAEAKNPLTLFDKASEGDPAAIAATGLGESIQVDNAKRTGKLTPTAIKHLNEEMKKFTAGPLTSMNPFFHLGRAIGGAGNEIGSLDTQRTGEFSAAMVKDGWSPATVREFLAKTGQTPKRASQKPKRSPSGSPPPVQFHP